MASVDRASTVTIICMTQSSAAEAARRSTVTTPGARVATDTVAAPTHRSTPAPTFSGFTHQQILAILGGLMLGILLAALDQTIVSTAIRTIADDGKRQRY